MRRSAGYSAEECESLFTAAVSDCDVKREGIVAQRTKTYKCGAEFLEVETYPVYGRAMASIARERMRCSREAQVRVNLRRSKDRLIRLANTNFGSGDMMITCTAFEAESEKAAQADVKNYIARLRYAFRKEGRELKYLYALEWTENEKYGRRYHVHILVNGHGMDRDRLEAMWKKSKCNTRRYQYDESGFAGLAAYLKIDKEKNAQTDKGKAGRRVWNASRNLTEPAETVSDHRLSRHKAERIATGLEIEAREILEKAYPDYRVVGEIRARRSDWVSGVYCYARMRRKDTIR